MAWKPYPRHVHKQRGVFKVVHSDAERDAAVAEGWALQPAGAGSPGPRPVETPDAPATAPDPPEAPAPRRRGRPPKNRSQS